MPVDVVTEIEIARPREEVASYTCDPDNATAWYENIEAVEWRTPKPLAIGSRLAFVAHFLGRRLVYTYEVREWIPGERFVMSTAEGPFPMETTYSWEGTADGGTRMTLRNCGKPTGFAKAAMPLMAAAMRLANRKDLRRLKRILERWYLPNCHRPARRLRPVGSQRDHAHPPLYGLSKPSAELT